MEFNTLRQHIIDNAAWYERKHDVDIDLHFAAYSLMKEMGQFADAMLVRQGKIRAERRVDDASAKDHLTQQLVDIVCLALINADVHDIDLETAITHKRWIEKQVVSGPFYFFQD